MDLSRRTLLAGAGAATFSASTALAQSTAPATAGGPAATQSTGATQPTGATQVPSAYRYKVGDVLVTAIADGARTFPLAEGFVRNQPKETVAAELKRAFYPEGQVTVTFTVLLLDIGGRKVLIDTGNGPAQGGTVGLLRPTLEAIGIAPAAVDQVVISHFHGDHINGLLTAEGKPAFPSAAVVVPEAEWAFWMDDGQMSRAPDAMKGAFQNVRRVFGAVKAERYGWDKEVAPGLTSVAAAGHTPGHTAFTLASGGQSLFIQSDITNIPALFVRHPGWHAGYDMDAVKAEDVRRRTYDRLAADRQMVAGYHFPFPGAAHLEKDGEGYRYVPVVWNPVI